MTKTKFLVMILSLAVVLLVTTSQAAETNANAVTARTQSTPKEFVFEGGDLDDFVAALGKLFEVDLFKIATIPDHMRSVRVPKMRTKARGFEDVLTLYNATSSEIDGVMGKWVIKYAENGYMFDYTKIVHDNRLPDVLLLTRKDDDQHVRRVTVKAFALKGLKDKRLNELRNVIDEEAALLDQRLRRIGNVGGSEIQGDIRYHKNAGILVASGGDQYVEMASSIIEAFRQAHGSEFNDLPEDPTSSKK
jgi:hypothetical protein